MQLQTNSIKGFYHMGDPHPYIKDRVFKQYVRRNSGIYKEKWTTEDKLNTNKEKIKKYNKKHGKKYSKRYSKNQSPQRKEYQRKYQRKYRKDIKNKQKAKEYQKKYCQNNLDKKSNAYAIRKSLQNHFYRNLKKENKEKIKNIYKLREELSLAAVGAGQQERYHVDHIYPLKNKQFCGLHTDWNLQIITEKENRKKYNKVI
jgi:hypothetical protein